MLRLLLKLTLAGAFLFALWSWVPLGGRTLSGRWAAAPTPLEFVKRGLADAGLAGAGDAPPGRAQARAARKERERSPERVTEAERRALERRLADELARE